MTEKQLQEQREARAKCIADARKILDAADADENRDLTKEEQEQWDRHINGAQKLGDKIKQEERQLAAELELATSKGRQSDPGDPNQPGPPDHGQRNGQARPTEMRWKLRLTGEERVFPLTESVRAAPEYGTGFDHWLRSGRFTNAEQAAASRQILDSPEYRALQADDQTLGGSMVPSEQFVARLIKFVDDFVFIRQLATVQMVTSADSLGVPSLDTDVSDADWTTELGTGSEDSSMKMGKRELHPYPAAKSIKVSNKLIRASAIPIEQLVLARLGYKMGVTHEKGFLTGDGIQKPLGVYTASSDGISTSRDVSSGNTATAIMFDGLINAKMSLKSPYRSKARWNFHRDAVSNLMKIKDGDGQYIWRQSMLESEPDRVLGNPIDESEFTPNTFTTGLYVGMIADWSHYWIADSLAMTMQRLVELHALTNQVGFIVRAESDGAPVLEEAFARVTLA